MITTDEIAVSVPAKRPRGRVSKINRDAALQAAMFHFWDAGYEASSISRLTGVMGITLAMLYTAFKSKDLLFAEAIERYNGEYGGLLQQAIREEPTAYLAIERWLNEAAMQFVQPTHPKGCMIVTVGTYCGDASESVCRILKRRRSREATRAMRCIKTAIEHGELHTEVDACALAKFYATVYQGMSIRARDGAHMAELAETVRNAMKAWPGAGAFKLAA
jgi:AcrR family transcriptional regulator